MVMPITNETKLEVLQEYNCFGLDSEAIYLLARDMSLHCDVDDKIKGFLTKINNGIICDDYPKEELYNFSIQQNVVELYDVLVNRVNNVPIQEALELASKDSYINTILPLFLTNLTLEKITSIINDKYSREYSLEGVQAFLFYFAKFDSMSSIAISRWIDSTPTRLRYLLRVARNERLYVLFDEIGIDSGLDLREVSSRVMSRSFRHFDELSKVGHYLSMKEAREWGKLALDAGTKLEKSKKGNMNDFVAEFQVSLVEANDSMIDHDDDVKKE
jgi:hypothetical protein